MFEGSLVALVTPFKNGEVDLRQVQVCNLNQNILN
mgnify:CR=1 FL=1